MSEQSLDPKKVYGPLLGNRWIQLTAAVIAMIMIANLQYAWTLFVPSIQTSFKASLTAVQFGFTLFIWFETFAQPVEGYLLDRFGPRLFFTLAGIMVGIGWTSMGLVHSLGALYFFYALSGLGAGFIYGGSVAVAIRWFGDKRGLAAGIIAAGFGAGSAPFIPIIGSLLSSVGYQGAFIYTGIFQGFVVLIVAQVLRYPPGAKAHHAQTSVAEGEKRGLKPWEVLRQPQFYLIYVMFLCMTIGGLLLTANAKPFAKDIHIASYFVILGVTIDRIGNGLGRIGWGGLSDKFGRENTMFIAFTLNAIFTATFPFFAKVGGGTGYVVWMFLMMATWGELFSLFPSLNADRFGTTYAASNYGLLYSAKGFGGILGGVVATAIVASFGWTVVFVASGFLAFLSGVGALVIKKLPKPTHPNISIGGGGITKDA